MHTAETVKRHKMQKVSELAQLAQMDKIHQQAKLGQMILVIKQAKIVKQKKYWTNLLNWPIFHWITLLLAVSHRKSFVCLCAPNHAGFSLISLNTMFQQFFWPNYAFFSFFEPKTICGAIKLKTAQFSSKQVQKRITNDKT